MLTVKGDNVNSGLTPFSTVVLPQLHKQQRISVKLGLADTLASGAKNRAQSVAVMGTQDGGHGQTRIMLTPNGRATQ